MMLFNRLFLVGFFRRYSFMAEMQNESKIENKEEEQPLHEIGEVEEEEQQQTSVTGEVVQTEIVKLTVVRSII